MNNTEQERKPHVHAEVIRAFADGYQVQYRRNKDSAWQTTPCPGFYSEYEYRIKPEPKPDVVILRAVAKVPAPGIPGRPLIADFMGGTPNVRYTFDGETGKLKSVEMIKGDSK